LTGRLAIVVLCVAAVLAGRDLLPGSASASSATGSGILKYLLGPEVLVSDNQDGGALRCEPSVVVYKNVVLVSWNDSHGGSHGTSKSKVGVSVGWAISLNRGQTFKFGGYLPQEKNGVLLGADSWLAADGAGNFYLQVLSVEEPYEIQVYYMDRHSLGRWQRMSNAATGPGHDLDKPSMSVDSEGRIGIAYNSGTSSIYFVMSKDKGASWAKPVRLSDSSTTSRLGAVVAMTKSRIVVSWAEGTGVDLREIWWTESEDGGQTFAPPALLFRSKESLQPPKGYAMGLGYRSAIVSLPCLTRSGGPGNESIYLSYAEGVGSGSRVLLFTLPAGGKSWSQPVPVGESPERAIKIMPSVAAIGSIPAVLYYDRRDDPDGALTDVYLSILDEGAKFQDLKLNAVSTDWTKTPGDKQYAPIQRNFGDYISLASDGDLLAAAWTDGRGGVPRIYMRTIEVKGQR
jgi:hypothetical protein